MSPKLNNKGFFNLIWALFTLFLTFIIMITATNIFSGFAKTPKQLIDTAQAYYTAEFGIYRAEWLLVNGVISEEASINIDHLPDTTGGAYGQAEDYVSIRIPEGAAANEYRIESNTLKLPKPMIGVRAHYLDGNIDELTTFYAYYSS